MTVLTHETLLAREIRREMSANIVWFVQHYFRDEEDKPFKFKPFHTEMLNACANEEWMRLLMLEPASFGKSTHVSKHYPLWLVALNPNVQILIGSKNSEDASKRLSVIKNEMEHNEELVNDWGPFLGPLWRADEIEVAQRTVNVKDPTIAVFGAGSSIMGKRATHLVLDDLIVPENSGAQVEDGTRQRVAQQYHDGIKKLGYPGKPLYIRMVNTVVHLQDLVHELGAIGGSVPEDSGVTTWESTKGFHVIRRPALINMGTPEEASLWPERRTVKSLREEKSEDLHSFLRRMQNLVLDPSNLNFRREWFMGDPANPEIPGCLDHSRSQNELPAAREGSVGVAWTRTGGYDPTSGMSDEAKWCAYVEIAFDKRQAEPRTYSIVEMTRFRAQIEDQAKFCIDRTRDHHLAILNIEDNFQQKWLLQLNTVKDAVASGLRIRGHQTKHEGKYDPDTGIPALAGRIRGGRIRFPYADPPSREASDALIGEFCSYPQGATTDLIMALWFAILAAERSVRESRSGIIERAISPFLLRHGLSASNVEKFYPPRRIVS